MADCSTNSLLNLTALQRIDNSITSIVESASQVCLYRFSLSEEWEKTSIEGTLFVYIRSKKPQHGFIIMNRLSTTNLIESITSDFEFEVQKPFILYRNIKGEVYGIWFYVLEDLSKIAKLLSSLSQLTVKKKERSPLKKRTPSTEDKRTKNNQHPNNFANMDILSLLSRAQEEYDKKVLTQSKSPADLNNKEYSTGKIVKPTPVRATNGVVMSDTTISIDTLFAQVGDGKHVFKGNENISRSKSLTEAGKTLKPQNNNILQKLLSNSNNGESRPRSATITGIEECHTSVEMVEKDLKEKLNILPKCNPIQETPLRPILKAKEIPVLTPAMLSSSLPTNSSPLFDFDKNVPEKNYSPSTSVLSLAKRHSPTTLLSPMDFQLSSHNLSSLVKGPSPLSQVETSHSNENLKTDLLVPSSIVGSSAAASLEPITITPLTKAQLREALTYMCQHDDDFVSQVHECYLKSLKCQLNHFKPS